MCKHFLLLALVVLSFEALAEGAIGYTGSSSNTATGGLTDEQFIKSKNYEHTSYINEKMKEACEKGDKDACSSEGGELDHKFLGVDGGAIKAVAKAYTTVMAAMGITGKKKDYCALIPAATEALATFQQTKGQETANITASQSTQQKEALYRYARSYDTRADTAKIEFAGFAASSACYPVMMYVNKDFSAMTIAKAAASVVLASFFLTEQKRYSNAAKFVKKVADQLPGKGDCNPVTEKECFCAQESSKNTTDYVTACVSEERRSTYIAGKGTPISCLDANMKVDASCRCASSNNCYSKTYAAEVQGLSFAKDLGTIFAPANEVINGTLSSAGLSASESGLNNAIRKLKDLEGKSDIKPEGNINKDEMKAYQDLGLTPALAAKLASTSPGAGYENNLKRMTASYSGKTISLPSVRTEGNNRIIEFGGSGSSRGAKKSSNSPGFDMSKFTQKNQPKGPDPVLNFPSDSTVDKALKNADITNDSSRSLFDIVSRRYQLSSQRLGN